MLARLAVDVMLVDEAAQATETLVLLGLQCRPRRLLLVGDHKQLPPTVKSSKAQHARWDRSLMQRLVECGVQPIMLDTQYRMHPQIVAWPNQQFYGGRLQNGQNTISQRAVPGWRYRNRSWWFDVHGQEQSTANSSFVNEAELQAVENIVASLSRVRRGEHCSIGVITFYSDQAQALKDRLRDLSTDNVTVVASTVDSFQGSEVDVAVISFVRTNAVGFLKDERRLNVALTRAKACQILVGDLRFFVQCSNPCLRAMVNFYKTRQFVCYPLSSLQ